MCFWFCAGQHGCWRCIVKVDGGSAIQNEDGAMFACVGWSGGVYGGLIAREDKPMVALMATWWSYGDGLHES